MPKTPWSRPLLRTVRLSGDDADIKVGGMSALPSALATHRHGERERMTWFYSNDFRLDDDCGRRRRYKEGNNGDGENRGGGGDGNDEDT